MKKAPIKLFLISTATIPLASCLTSCGNQLSTINIVGLDDLHGCVQQYHNNDMYEELIKCTADTYLSIKNKNPDNTYFLLLGDNTDTSPICEFTGQLAGCDLLESFHPEFSVLGNHELEYNVDTYLNPESEDSFTKVLGIDYYLCCNAYRYNEAESKFKLCECFQPYTIKHIGDLNVGFVGYIASNVPGGTPNPFTVYSAEGADNKNKFLDTGMTGTEILQKAIDDCHEDALNFNNGVKPDVVILAQHEGNFRDGEINWQQRGSYQVINHISGVDASMEAHSHVNYNLMVPDKNNKLIPCCQSGSNASYLNNLKITYDKSKSNINCSFTTPKINQNTLKGQLANKKDPMIADLQKKLDYWYGLPYDEDEPTITISDKLDEKLTSFSTRYMGELSFSLSIDIHDSFSRASHMLVDYLLDEFNNTTVTSKPELLVDAIDEIKEQLPSETGSDVIDGAIGTSFRNDLAISGVDSNDPRIHYLRIRDMLDILQSGGPLYIVKISVKDLNDCLTNHVMRSGRVDPFYFKNYLVNWDKSNGDTYATAEKVWLCDKDGNALDNNINLVIAAYKKVYNKYIEPFYDISHVKLTDKEVERPIAEHNYWTATNNFPMYVNTFLDGVYDMSTYKYDEHNYLYF